MFVHPSALSLPRASRTTLHHLSRLRQTLIDGMTLPHTLCLHMCLSLSLLPLLRIWTQVTLMTLTRRGLSVILSGPCALRGLLALEIGILPISAYPSITILSLSTLLLLYDMYYNLCATATTSILNGTGSHTLSLIFSWLLLICCILCSCLYLCQSMHHSACMVFWNILSNFLSLPECHHSLTILMMTLSFLLFLSLRL